MISSALAIPPQDPVRNKAIQVAVRRVVRCLSLLMTLLLSGVAGKQSFESQGATQALDLEDMNNFRAWHDGLGLSGSFQELNQRSRQSRARTETSIAQLATEAG